MDETGGVPAGGGPERPHVPPIPPVVEHAAPVEPDGPVETKEHVPPLAELGTPRMQPIPERRRWPIVVAIVAVVLLLVASAAFAVWRLAGSPAPPSAAPGGSSSGSVTTLGAGTAATSSPGATAAPGTSSTAGGGVGLTTAPGSADPFVTKPIARARLIAYRRDSAEWVADDAGADRRRVSSFAEGVFALSPDGTRLALVDPEAHFLSIVNVATGRETTIGPAEDRMPSWAPDGAWLAYTGLSKGTRAVMRVGRDGTAPAVLAVGFAPQVTPDGKSVYFLQPGHDTGGLLTRTDATVGGQPVTIVVPEVVSAFALSGKALVYSTGQGAQALIWRSGLDGSEAVRLVAPPKDPAASGYANLILSPDGRLLLFGRTGDDGYSRISVVALTGGAPVELSSRKDDYPMGWTVDSARVVFVSGNSFQGEKTDVVTVKPNGAQRRVIVPGGSL